MSPESQHWEEMVLGCSPFRGGWGGNGLHRGLSRTQQNLGPLAPALVPNTLSLECSSLGPLSCWGPSSKERD